MKVGLITLDGNHNYGNRLQLYACTKIYSQLGFETVNLIAGDDLYTNELMVRKAKHFAKSIIRKREEPDVELSMAPERLEAFLRFNGLFDSEIVNLNDIKRLNYRFDYFSVGSDQVWNPNYCKYRDDWYFLKFARPEQRIALSPSIGVELLDRSQKTRLRKGVEGFSFLSVREQRGFELIKEAAGKNASVIADPTIVIGSEIWKSIESPRVTPKQPYLFTYLLGDSNCELNKLLKEVSQGGSIPVVPLSDRQRQGEPNAGPAEFISLIHNAEHVITDSFHAAVFASLMQTPLTIVRRSGGKNMFSRLEQLSRMLGIEHKIYGSSQFDIKRASNYEGVPEAIDDARNKFLQYLELCLNG